MTELNTMKTINEIESEGTATVPVSNKRLWKNLFVLGIAWTLLYTAFQSISNLQSSLNIEDNVGLNSMAIMYSFLIFSCILLPHPMMSILGMKWTIVLCQFGYLAFIASNLYGKPALMYPASILSGLAAAPFWTAKGTYVTEIGTLYSELKGINFERGITKFFGIFFTMFETSQIWGNLISYLVLRDTTTFIEDNKGNKIKTNQTDDNTFINLTQTRYQCGGQFKENEHPSEDYEPVPQKTLFTLYFICIGITVLSIILIACFLDQRRKKLDKKELVKTSIHRLASTFKNLRHPYQLLLIPITIWLGLEQGYLSAQYTKGFITCSVGIKYVGLIMIVDGVCDALSSFLTGHIIKYMRHFYWLIFIALINYGLIFTMLFWIPTSKQLWVLFVIAALWGVTDGSWQTQIGATYGILFKEHESAFSNFRLWESVGFVAAYVYSPRIRIQHSLFILLSALTVSIICFGVIEYMEHKRKKKESNDSVITVF